MLAYYAHCQAIYETPQEDRDHKLIKKLGYTVILFGDEVQIEVNAVQERGGLVMEEVFYPLVDKASVLFFRALPDGSVPAGVYGEILHAQTAGIPVLELPCGIQRRALNVSLTREYLREIGQR